MIISHKHKFIFIKCRKTASTSIELALSAICGENDIITPIFGPDEEARKSLGLKGPQNTLVPVKKYTGYDWARLIIKGTRKEFYNHMPAVEIKKYVDLKVWDSYFKFCFERNPFDKIISHYYWAGGNQSFGNISKYLENKGYRELKGFDMYSIDQEVVVDEVFKYENLESAIQIISQKIGLKKHIQLPQYKAKSGYRKDNRNYDLVLDSHQKNIIRKLFHNEFHYLKY